MIVLGKTAKIARLHAFLISRIPVYYCPLLRKPLTANGFNSHLKVYVQVFDSIVLID